MRKPIKLKNNRKIRVPKLSLDLSTTSQEQDDPQEKKIQLEDTTQEVEDTPETDVSDTDETDGDTPGGTIEEPMDAPALTNMLTQASNLIQAPEFIPIEDSEETPVPSPEKKNGCVRGRRLFGEGS